MIPKETVATVTSLRKEARFLEESAETERRFVSTYGGSGQSHPAGLVGRLWRIGDPATVNIGNCFLAGRLKAGDLFLCTGHTGDSFQNYIFVEEFANCWHGRPQWTFGSYGIGDAIEVPLPAGAAAILMAGAGGRILRQTYGGV